jgi:heme exporter protein A
MLEARNLTKRRGDHRLFEHLSFQVDAGTALILRGPNGVGKTTLLRVLCGLTLPEEGEIRWNGETRPLGLRGLVAYAAHQPALNMDLTVRQNLAFYAHISRSGDDWRRWLTALELERCADLEVRRLSAGQRRRAGIARVLMSGLQVWLLDEPFANLDSAGRALVNEHVAGHLASGGIAVIAAHDQMLASHSRAATLMMSVPDA